MKPTMLLALSFLLFALTTIAIFPGGTVVAQQTTATVLDIFGHPVLTGAKYYIYGLRGRVAGLSKDGHRVYLYDEIPDGGTPVIISQGNRSNVVVDTALEIKFNNTRLCGLPYYWKAAVKFPYFVTIGDYDEGHKFTLAQKAPGGSHLPYYLNYTPISPFCDKPINVNIGLVDKYIPNKYLAANTTTTFQFNFLPVNESTAGVGTPLLKSMNILRTMY